MFEEVLFQVLSNGLFHHGPIAALFNGRLIHGVHHELPAFGQQPFFFDERDASKDDFRCDFHHSGLFVNGDDRQNNSVFGDVPTVANDDFADFLQASFVNQNAPDGRFAGDLGTGLREPQDVARLHDDVLFRSRRWFSPRASHDGEAACTFHESE